MLEPALKRKIQTCHSFTIQVLATFTSAGTEKPINKSCVKNKKKIKKSTSYYYCTCYKSIYLY